MHSKYGFPSADHENCDLVGPGWSPKSCVFTISPGDSDVPSGTKGTELAQLTHFVDEKTVAYEQDRACPGATFRTGTQSS